MEKVIALLWADAEQDAAAFNAQLLQRLPDALAAAGGSAVRINVEDDESRKGAKLRQSRGERQHDAVVQFWLDSANALFRGPIDAAIEACCARWAGWVVAESVVIPNREHPPIAGARCWGWSQMAFLTVPDRLTHAAWLEAWQDRHTLVAIETQANFEYVQNLVVHPITPNAPPYAAIVEECFPTEAIGDPLAFFDAPGDVSRFKANLARMMESCDRFIEPGTIDVIPTSQYDFASQ